MMFMVIHDAFLMTMMKMRMKEEKSCELMSFMLHFFPAPASWALQAPLIESKSSIHVIFFSAKRSK